MATPEVILGRQIPTLQFTLQNILMSAAAAIAATASLMLTIMVVLPLAMCRSLLPSGVFRRPVPEGLNKVVLIVGASGGIGSNILKIYKDDPDTVIIAASSSIDSVREKVNELGHTPATIQCAELDLTASKKHLTQSIRLLDKQFGPITHLYEVSGISNHLNDDAQWGMAVTENMINVNVSGTVTSVLIIYELMKQRQYGTICIVGSVAGLYGPANMISYAATKSFINTFASCLRILAAPSGVDVITVQPGFIDTRMTKQMRGQESSVPAFEFESAYGMAAQMKSAVEDGGVSLVSWPVRQSVVMHSLTAINPICDELGRWVSMKMGVAGKKIT